MHTISLALNIVLAAYIVWEVIRFVPRYRRLKQQIANGDTRARTRIYYEALAFEWISALLALLALRFDWNKLNPNALAIADSRWLQPLSQGAAFDRGATVGLFFGVALGALGFLIVRIKANRRRVAPAPNARPPWWRKLLPDFSALLPATAREKYLWSALAISAGVCEEVVFRGWLFATLHDMFALAGLTPHATMLVLLSAAIFGLAHGYQRIAGMVLTAFAGVLLGVLYIKTGSLFVPIVLHILLDLRFAILPAPRANGIS